MTQTTGPNLGLIFGWDDGDSGWGQSLNLNLKKLDAITGLSVISFVNAPPSAVEGDRFIVGGSPSGAFSGHPWHVAAYSGGEWAFYPPSSGVSALNMADHKRYEWINGAWAVPSPSPNPAMFLDVSGQGVVPVASWSRLRLTNVITDTAGAWRTADNEAFIAPLGGLYQVTASVRFSAEGDSPAPVGTNVAIMVGAEGADSDDAIWGVTPAEGLYSLTCTTVVRLVPGAILSLFAKQSSGSGVGLTRARLRIVRISD